MKILSIIVCTLVAFVFLFFLGTQAVDITYLGFHPNYADQLIILNNVTTNNTNILSIKECCGGHMNMFEKKYPFPYYIWTESGAWEDRIYFKWYWET